MPGGPNVALISHDLWQRKFGSDPSVVGRQVTLSGQSFTITGVMPPGFAFPRGAELPSPFQFGARTDLWTPLVFDSSDVRNYGMHPAGSLGSETFNQASVGIQLMSATTYFEKLATILTRL